MSAQEATQTYDCRVPGCTNPAEKNRGPNAYLCATHILERPAISRRKPAASDNGYLGKVTALTSAAKRVDKAKARLELAETEFAQAKADWNQAVDQLDLPFIEKTP